MSYEIEPGYYKARAIAGSEQYSDKNGKDQIAIDMAVPELNRTLTVILYFSDAAAQYSVPKLRSLGWVGDDISKLVGIDTNEVEVQVRYETFEGKERMKVDIAGSGGGRIKLENIMDEKAKRGFAARMKALVSSSAGPKPANGARPQQQQQRQAPQGNDDDPIPF